MLSKVIQMGIIEMKIQSPKSSNFQKIDFNKRDTSVLVKQKIKKMKEITIHSFHLFGRHGMNALQKFRSDFSLEVNSLVVN